MARQRSTDLADISRGMLASLPGLPELQATHADVEVIPQLILGLPKSIVETLPIDVLSRSVRAGGRPHR